MKITMVNLDTVCGITSRLPANTLPEFAFLGHSNVGKSSVINALMQRKNYAHTSGDPGKTQTINYYNINDALYLVDLPGYGYARVSRVTREKWGKMIERYLTTSPTLRLIFLLVDSRHEPTGDDKTMLEWLSFHGLPTAVIATKADKLKPGAREGQLAAVRGSLAEAAGFPEEGLFLPFSAVTKEGREAVYALLEKEVQHGKSVEANQGQ